jgi:hypothetical protein
MSRSRHIPYHQTIPHHDHPQRLLLRDPNTPRYVPPPIPPPQLTPHLLNRLLAATTTLREHHTTLRAQNDAVVKTALAMATRLGPIEDGLRIEKEQTMAKECVGGVLPAGTVEDEPSDEVVETVADAGRA